MRSAMLEKSGPLDLLPQQAAIERDRGLADRRGQVLILEDLREGLGVRPNIEDRVRHWNKQARAVSTSQICR